MKFELTWLLGIAILGALGERLFGAGLAFLCAGLAVYMVRHLYNLMRLNNTIRNRKRVRTPFPRGLWGLVYKNIYALQRRSRKRKRRLTNFVKRFTESAAAFPDAAVIIGRSGDIEWCNPAALELLGLDWPRVSGQNIGEMVSDPIFREYLAERDYVRPVQFRSPMEQTKILSACVTPFGKKRQQLLVARDITELYYVDRVRQDFIANASHELRTPLTVIRGFLEVMDERSKEQPGRNSRPVELMLQQTTRMEQTIDQLLTLSRLEHEGQAVSDERINVAELLTKITAEAEALSGENKHRITLSLEDQRYLLGNEFALRSAFSNLIFNAVRYTPPHSRIQVSWAAHDGGAQLSVTDNGEGIPARHIPRLTERFYRIDPGRSRDAGGTGLGLAITKHALACHDAELGITSEVGKGSTFTCVFPATRLVDCPCGRHG